MKEIMVGDRVQSPADEWGIVRQDSCNPIFPYEIEWSDKRRRLYSAEQLQEEGITVHPPAPESEDIEEEEMALWGEDVEQGEWKIGDRCIVPHLYGASNVPGTIIKHDPDLGWAVQVDEWWKLAQVREPEQDKPLGNGWWKSEELKPCLDSSTCAAGSASGSPSPDCSLEDLNSSDSASGTNIARTSSQGDIREFTSIQTCENLQIQPNPGLDTGSRNPEESIVSRPRHHANPSASKASDSELTTSEIAFQWLSDSLKQSNPSSLQSKTSEGSSIADISQGSSNPTLDFYSRCFPGAGSMLNGSLYAADTLVAPSLENGCSWLESPGALSSTGNGRPPGQSRLEAQLRNLGAIAPQEVVNPIFLEGGFSIPEEWSNPSELCPATQLLADAEKPSETASTHESQPSPSGESSILIPSSPKDMETWTAHILVVGDIRPQPWTLPPIEACEVVKDTAKKVNATSQQGETIQKFKDKVWYLPRREYWHQLQNLHQRLQLATDALANALRNLGSYESKLEATGGYKKAPNPLSPTVIVATADPDDSEASTYWLEGFSIPTINRHPVEKHTPQMLKLSDTEQWVGRVIGRRGCFVCPTDESWEKVRSLHEEATRIQGLVEEYLEFLGTYDKAEWKWANPKEYLKSLGEKYLDRFTVEASTTLGVEAERSRGVKETLPTDQPTNLSTPRATPDVDAIIKTLNEAIAEINLPQYIGKNGGTESKAYKKAAIKVKTLKETIALVESWEHLPNGTIVLHKEFGEGAVVSHKLDDRTIPMSSVVFDDGIRLVPTRELKKLEVVSEASTSTTLSDSGLSTTAPKETKNTGTVESISSSESSTAQDDAGSPSESKTSETEPGTLHSIEVGSCVFHPEFLSGVVVSIDEPTGLWGEKREPVTPEHPLVLWENGTHHPIPVRELTFLGEGSVPTPESRIGTLVNELQAIAHRTGEHWAKTRQQVGKQIQSLDASTPLNMPIWVKQPGEDDLEGLAQVDLGGGFLIEVAGDSFVCAKLYVYPRDTVLVEAAKPLATKRGWTSDNDEYEVLRIEGTDAILVMPEYDVPQRIPLNKLELNEAVIALLTDEQLDAAIKSNHEACEDYCKEAVSALNASLWRAKQAGQMLLVRKDKLAHGEWLPWLERNGIKERSSQVYMRVAKKWNEIVKSAATYGIGLEQLTLDGAIKLIRSSKQKAGGAEEDFGVTLRQAQGGDAATELVEVQSNAGEAGGVNETPTTVEGETQDSEPKIITTEEVVKELAIGLRSLPTNRLETVLETVKPIALVKAATRIAPEALQEWEDAELEEIANNTQILLEQVSRLLKERQQQRQAS